ncbi:MAG: hypothetical protein EOM20_18980, partial [Spartobacteria bacterium]|nr:hypothetical protein [Spartobacteria bacterium]
MRKTGGPNQSIPSGAVLILLLLLVCRVAPAQPLSATVASEDFAIKENVDVLSPGILLGVNGYGACLAEFHQEGDYTLIVIAHAENPEQEATLQITLNKESLTTLEVRSAGYSSYTFSQAFPAGFHEIGFSVPNAAREGAILLESLTILPAKGLERISVLDADSFKRRQYERTERPCEEALRRIDTIRKGTIHFRVVDKHGQPVPGAVIEVAQKRHEFPFGVKVPGTPDLDGSNMERYLAFSDYLNAVSLEHVCLGWCRLKAKGGSYDFSQFDHMASLFRRAGFSVWAGCLFPGNEQEAPLWAKQATDKQLSAAIRQLSRILAAHTQPALRGIDVETLRGGYLLDRLGPGIFRQVLHELHAANPELARYVRAESPMTAARTAAIAEQFKRQVAQGLDYDGLSLLGRLAADTPPGQIKDALDELSRIRKPVLIQGPVPDGAHAPSREEIALYYQLAFSHPAVSGLYAGGDEDAADVLRELIAENWWTKEKRVTNRKGQAGISAFFGQHRIAVHGPDGRHVNVTVRFPSHTRTLHLVVRLTDQNGTVHTTKASPR